MDKISDQGWIYGGSGFELHSSWIEIQPLPCFIWPAWTWKKWCGNDPQCLLVSICTPSRNLTVLWWALLHSFRELLPHSAETLLKINAVSFVIDVDNTHNSDINRNYFPWHNKSIGKQSCHITNFTMKYCYYSSTQNVNRLTHCPLSSSMAVRDCKVKLHLNMRQRARRSSLWYEWLSFLWHNGWGLKLPWTVLHSTLGFTLNSVLHCFYFWPYNTQL